MNTSIFTKDGKFNMLALDHRESFRKILNPQNPAGVPDNEIIKLKSEIIESLASQFSGLLVDVEYGLPAYRSLDMVKGKPYLLAIEKSGYKDISGERVTELQYSVSELKKNGASGIKLLLYFNPQAATVSQQLKTAKQVMLDCFSYQLPFFLEIVTYDLPGKQRELSELVIDSVQTFLDEKIIPQVFKLKYPGDSHSCDELTGMLGTTPWILLTRGDDYEQFKSDLADALIHGASGFLAGRALWQEIGQYKTVEERKNFLQITVTKRFSEIAALTTKRSFLA